MWYEYGQRSCLVSDLASLLGHYMESLEVVEVAAHQSAADFGVVLIFPARDLNSKYSLSVLGAS